MKVKTGKAFGRIEPGATISTWIDGGGRWGGGTHGFVVVSVGETLPDGRVLITGYRQRKSRAALSARNETIAFQVNP